jgi:O-antigen ligase
VSLGTRAATAGTVALLALATLGEGGAAPGALVAWHGMLWLLLLGVLWRAPREAALPRGLGAALALFCSVALVQGALAPYAFASWLFLVELGAFVATLVVAHRCGRSLLALCGPPLLAAGALQGGWVVVQLLRGAARPAGSFLNTNHLAAWLVAVTLLAAGPAWLETASGRRRIGRSLAGAVLVAAVWLTGSRGALLGLAAGAAVLAVGPGFRLPRRRRLLIAGVGLAAVAVLGGTLWVRRQGEADPFRYQRVKIWRASLEVLGERPWTGSGPRQFAQAARNHQFPDGEGRLRYDRGFNVTHSDLLRVPCELGWPGAAAGLFVVAALALALRRRAREDGWGATEQAALAALAALATQALVDNLSQRPAIYLLQAALVGALLARSGRSAVPSSTDAEEPGPGPRWPPAASRAAWLVLCATVFVVGDLSPYLAWRAAARSGEGRAAIERALRRNPLQPEYWRLRARSRIGGASVSVDDYLAAREEAERAVRLDRGDSDAFWTLAQVEERGCRSLFRDVASRERTRDRYRRAAELSRFNTVIPLIEARFLLDTDDPSGARRAAERALTLEPESVVPRLLLARALLEQEGPPAAARARALVEEARERATALEPGEAESFYARSLLVPDPALMESVSRALASARGAPGASGAGVGSNGPG